MNWRLRLSTMKRFLEEKVNALTFVLLSVIPYLSCMGFHLTKTEEKIQKVELVTSGKNNNLQHKLIRCQKIKILIILIPSQLL